MSPLPTSRAEKRLLLAILVGQIALAWYANMRHNHIDAQASTAAALAAKVADGQAGACGAS